LCVAHLRKILERARDLDIFVRIDMESSAYTQRTLDVHRQLWEAGFTTAGSCCRPTCTARRPTSSYAIENAISVRLCKGAISSRLGLRTRAGGGRRQLRLDSWNA